MQKLLFLILTMSLSVIVCAQENDVNTNLKTQKKLFPQEKVYVMTDREMYATGDTIWFRGWVLDGETLAEKQLSKYLYVELRDPFGNLHNRVRVHLNKDNVYEGYIPLDITLSSNGYTLAAYTYYMVGTNEHFFFKKIVDVLTPSDILSGYSPQNLSVKKYPEHYNDVNPGESSSFEIDVPANGTYAVSVTHFSINPSNPDAIDHNLPNQKDLFTSTSINTEDEYLIPTYPFEQGNVISGTVFGNFNYTRPLKDVKVTTIAFDEKMQIIEGMTDKNGHFEIAVPEVEDGVTYLVQARKKKDTKLNIEFDKSLLPEKITPLPIMPNHFVKKDLNTSDDINTKKWALSLKDNQSILLDEVIVDEKKIEEPLYRFESVTTRSKVFSHEESFRMNSYVQLLSEVGVHLENNKFYYHSHLLDIYFDGKPALISDNPVLAFQGDASISKEKFTYDTLTSFYPPMAIKAVEIMNVNECMHYPQREFKTTYVLNLVTRKGDDMLTNNEPLSYCKHFTQLYTQKPLNFNNNSKSKEYSSPIIYWNPSLKANNEGKLNFEISVPEQSAATYRITVEGIGPNGELVHKEKFIRSN